MLNLNATQRRLKIFELLEQAGSVDTSDLANVFGVSTMTIRRDLNHLEKQGIALLNYGGATLGRGALLEHSFYMKEGQQQCLKQAIGYEASQLINDGESIIIDCGTTAFELAKHISNKHITVLTNSWKVLTILHDFPNVQIILAPGSYDRISQGAISTATIDFLKMYTVDKAFISTQGVSIEKGVSVPSDTDALVKRALLKCAKYSILLADSSKFGNSYLANHGNLKDFDLIITDNLINEEVLNGLENDGIDVLVANSNDKNKLI